MITSYKTLSAPAQSEYKEKGSRFLGFALPASTEMEVKEHLEGLRKKYHDARHHCYAYVLLPDKSKFRANDDGEPNHSAGDPILGQLRAHDVTNVLLVVVRYFGGTKLGVGGLVQAYRTTAREVLQRAQIVVREVMHYVQLECDYTSLPDVRRAVSNFGLEISEQHFHETGCQMQVRFRIAVEREFKEWIQVQQAMGVALRIKELALS